MVRIHPDPPEFAGAVAQLGEHLLCKQGVVGSIPSSSTNCEPGSGSRTGVMQNPEASGSRAKCGAACFWFTEPVYRLFFNNSEEVKQSCSTSRMGGASLLSYAWSGMGWIVSTCRSLRVRERRAAQTPVAWAFFAVLSVMG